MDLKVFDNFLSQKHYQELVEFMDNSEWYYNSMIVYDHEEDPDQYQFVMPIWAQGWIHQRYLVELFSTYLEPRAWVRIKANFSPKRNEIIENELHVDSNHPLRNDGRLHPQRIRVSSSDRYRVPMRFIH